ncbi:hypothetical protein ACB092_06G016200 [Castanea dentata]
MADATALFIKFQQDHSNFIPPQLQTQRTLCPALTSSRTEKKIKLNKRYKLEKKIASNWIILLILFSQSFSACKQHYQNKKTKKNIERA